MSKLSKLRWTLSVLSTITACAKMEPPPGGPEDRDPPTIVEISPPPGAFGVAPDSAVIFIFSEKPDTRSVMRSLVVLPRRDFRETSWENGRLRLLPEESWPLDRTTILYVGKGARDRRGNVMGQPFLSRFTTKALPDSASVRGKVWPGREVKAGEPVFVAAYSKSPSSEDTEGPSALSLASASGEFRLEGLDAADSFRVVAFLDEDGDLAPSSEREPASPAPGTVEFSQALEVSLPDFLLGTLDSLGEISGSVKLDSGALAVVVAENVASGSRGIETLAKTGRFSLALPTGGSYRVFAFLDADGDSTLDEGERMREKGGRISLELTSRAEGIELDLRNDVSGPENPEETPSEIREESAPPGDPGKVR